MANIFNLYDAQVIDTNDVDKKRKIKIRILPEQENIADHLLPWALPFSSFNSTLAKQNDLPSKDSLIRVLVDEYWQRFYYLGNQFFEETFDFSSISSKLNSVSELQDKEYKNLVFRLYEDGSLDFHNNFSGEHGFLHKNGSYSLFDSLGNATINAGVGGITIKGGNITISGGNVSITGGSLSVKGSVVPDLNGPFLALKFDSMTGAPMAGSLVIGT